VGQAGYNLGLCDKVNGGATTDCRAGKGGDWVDVMLNWRYTFLAEIQPFGKGEA
jgi:hypothetical protein